MCTVYALTSFSPFHYVMDKILLNALSVCSVRSGIAVYGSVENDSALIIRCKILCLSFLQRSPKMDPELIKTHVP